MTHRVISLKFKLVFVQLLILLLATATFSVASYFGLSRLSLQLSILNKNRYESSKIAYHKNSERNIQTIQNIYEKNLENKGHRLLTKDSASLAPLIAGNEFFSVQHFLRKTFEDDPDIVLASYFTLNLKKNEIKAWQFLSNDQASDLSFPFLYSISKKGWQGESKKKGKVFIFDPAVATVLNLTQPRIKAYLIKNNQEQVTGFDCIIPFVDGSSGGTVKKARVKKEEIGFLRYVLSPKEMNHAIVLEQQKLSERLNTVEEENKIDFKKSQEIRIAEISNILKILIIVAIAILACGCFIAFLFATRIAHPIQVLTKSSEGLAKGQYDQNIKIHSNDEIGILAKTFQFMSQAIQKHERDLAEINRSLEKTVELRTLQLRQEFKNVSNLLNNMKQAVFAVSKDWKVVPPVSKFSNSVFNKNPEGNSVLDLVYNGLDLTSEQYSNFKSALSVVFDESEAQWDLVAEYFPARVELEIEEIKKILRINYSPLFDENGLLQFILMVIEDFTAVEQLEKEIQNQRKDSEILNELSKNQPKVIKDYFRSMGCLLNEIYQVLVRKQSSHEDIHLIFRNFHTMKGNSRGLGFKQIAQMTHKIENDCDLIKVKYSDPMRNNMTQDELILIKNGFDQIKEKINEYIWVAAPIYDFKDEFKVKLVSELQKVLIEFGWNNHLMSDSHERWSHDSSLASQNLQLIVAVSAELGFSDNGSDFDQLSKIFKIKNKKLPQLLNVFTQLGFRMISKICLSSGFVPHSGVPTFWASLGNRILLLSDLILKLNENNNEKNLINLKKNISEFVSFSERNHFLFYHETLKFLNGKIKDDEVISIDNLNHINAIKNSFWSQYLFSIKFLISNQLKIEDNLYVQKQFENWKNSKKYKETNWVTQYLMELDEFQVQYSRLMEEWSSGVRLSQSKLLDILSHTNKDELKIWNELSSILFDFDHEEEAKKAKLEQYFSLYGEFVLKNLRLTTGNLYLKCLDICQMLLCVFEKYEFIENRYKSVEVLELKLSLFEEEMLKFMEKSDSQGSFIQKKLMHALASLLEVPVKPFLWNLQSVVSNYTKVLNKKVKFLVSCEDITLNKTILDSLKDCFIHLVNNAIEHGIIESGNLHIVCYQKKEEIIFRLKDDGKGMDPEQIVIAAQQKGLLSDFDAKTMSNQEKLNLIFIPGFSTKTAISEGSGRGIGMDVVKKNIQNLGGNILIESQVGSGTVVEIQIPI